MVGMAPTPKREKERECERDSLQRSYPSTARASRVRKRRAVPLQSKGDNVGDVPKMTDPKRRSKGPLRCMRSVGGKCEPNG